MIFVNCLSGLNMTGDNLISESQLTITPAGQPLTKSASLSRKTLHLISFISDSLFPRASLG